MSSEKEFQEIISNLKSLEVWSHSAHLICKEDTFFGDHEFLSELYQKSDENFDSVSEKALIFGIPDSSFEPSALAENIKNILMKWPNISGTSQQNIVESTFNVIKNVLEVIKTNSDTLSQSNKLSKGFDNLLSQISDDLEKFQYKISRRTKKGKQV